MVDLSQPPMEDRSHTDRPRSASAIVRFGPFELDLRSGELRKHDARVRLQEQPFQILSALLERPGEVVLREEIRERLWPDATIVEFDHSINAAVKRLRDALRESAENPLYIETVARRGYRFKGQVDASPAGPPNNQAESTPEARLNAGPAAAATVQRSSRSILIS